MKFHISYTGSLRILSGLKTYGHAVLTAATPALLWYNITGMGLDLNLFTQNQIKIRLLLTEVILQILLTSNSYSDRS